LNVSEGKVEVKLVRSKGNKTKIKGEGGEISLQKAKEKRIKVKA
jgi:hypothetical protein